MGCAWCFAQALDGALARNGLTRVPTVGLVFDPTKHEAVQLVELASPRGVVVEEAAAGYMDGYCLLRAAQVLVSGGG